MTAPVAGMLSSFAADTAAGLSLSQKSIPSRYFYDALGSALFEAITLLPEYGLTRAEERIVRVHSCDIAGAAGSVDIVAELGSGSGTKTKHLLRALTEENHNVVYRPIDVSRVALESCARSLNAFCSVRPVCCDWLDGLKQIAQDRATHDRLLLLFLGSSIGNVARSEIGSFLEELRSYLQPDDLFLLGVDLIKDVETMLAAYDDPTGVTAAFNLNILGHMNRELGADFDLRAFAHEARWNAEERRIEMHLLCCRDQVVHIRALGESYRFRAGETIWTESSHKFDTAELNVYARSTGFAPIATWVDRQWPFAETLWQAI
jgi:dimethylhistidine N-methyltransferase